MAMGKRKEVEQPLFLITSRSWHGRRHPFIRAINQLLGMDWSSWSSSANGLSMRIWSRPSRCRREFIPLSADQLLPGDRLRRGIAWRAADSLSLRMFLSVPLDGNSPDHSTISRTRRLIDLETHHEVFVFVLKLLAEHDLIDGKTIGVDATTLEANAALRSIVRRDSGESYQAFLTKLAQASRIKNARAG